MIPLLGCWNSITNNIQPLRPLTDEEIAHDQRYRLVFAEAQGRLKLFRILDLNYKAWEDRLRLEMMPGPAKEDGHLVLDQLMLNFLNTVYAISEHFRLSFLKRYRKNEQKLQEFNSFQQKLYDNSWPVAFFADFRNYVQHCSLPIGSFTRNETRYGVKIEVTHNAGELCQEFRDWKKSHLKPERGTLDFIDLLEECYHRFRKDYGMFIVKTFYPELKAVDDFYGTLAQEAKSLDPKARMVIVLDHHENNDPAKREINVTFEFPPNAVFDELGITFRKGATK